MNDWVRVNLNASGVGAVTIFEDRDVCILHLISEGLRSCTVAQFRDFLLGTHFIDTILEEEVVYATQG